MITSEQCKDYLDECRELGAARNISNQRATAVMAICRALIKLSQEIAIYDRVLEEDED
jgi:hypothetical protein